MKLLLKRDENGNGFPSPDQVLIGELVINSVTGRLYSKLTDGSIVEWIAQKICFDPIPDISFAYESVTITNDIIEGFCCTGGILEFEISKLKPSPYNYSFELIELTNNTIPTDISIQMPKYSDYTIPNPTKTNETMPVRKAIVPVNLSISNSQQNISIFKFVVNSMTDNKKLIEKIITIKCGT